MSGNEVESDSDPVDRRATAAAELLAREAVEESGRSEGRRRPRGDGRSPPSDARRGRRAIGWAVAFAVLGVGASVGVAVGLVPPEMQGVVSSLGGAGVFLSLLTLALTQTGHPNREAAIFDRLAGNYERVAADLGLAETHYYVPTGGEPPVRLFWPRDTEDPVPSVDKLSTTFVGRRGSAGLLGLALDPSGLALLPEAGDDLPSEPRTLVGQLCGGLVDRMEVAEIAQPNVDATTGRATVAFRGTAWGPIERFDHPVRSFVGCGLALGLDRPVRTEILETADGEFRVRYSWQAG